MKSSHYKPKEVFQMKKSLTNKNEALEMYGKTNQIYHENQNRHFE